MVEFDELYEDEFFIIDSNNLESVKSKLYGYIIDNDKIITDEDDIKINELSLNGAYVLVSTDNNTITLNQDVHGSYGIHVYKEGDYFCISNSFLKLVDYIKYNHKITLNEDISKTFLISNLGEFLYKQTLINEIEVLPRNVNLTIDLESKVISYDFINFKEKTIALDSTEGIKTLDSWYYKWCSLISSIGNDTNNIQVDLTGGFDTRVVFALLINSINLNNIYVKSLNDGKHVHDEDYEIASQIANEFGFKLNDKSNYDVNYVPFKEMNTSINVSFYPKLGFHNQMYYNLGRTKEKKIIITGFGGELIREYPVNINDFIERTNNFCPEYERNIKNIIDYNVSQIKKDFDVSDEEDILPIIYRETRSRYHYAKQNVEKFLINSYNLNPLMDIELNKLKSKTDDCDDSMLLVSLIFLRYCPKLLDFKFEGNRKIDEKTLAVAKRINDKYPLSMDLPLNISENKESIEVINEPNNNFSNADINNYLKEIFLSESFKNNFKIYFSHKLYDKFATRVETLNYFPLRYAYPGFAILKVINDVKLSNGYNHNINSWLDYFLKIPEYDDKIYYSIEELLLNYLKARIDIINYGNDSSIELIDISDKNAEIIMPSWLDSKKGYGIVVQSYKTCLNILVKCINDGQLKIFLRGRNITDRNKNRFPIYIDFTKFQINDEDILMDNKLVWHDKPFIHTLNVKNNDLLHIIIEWKPFSMESNYNG